MDAFDSMRGNLDGETMTHFEEWRRRQLAKWQEIKAEKDDERKRVMIQEFLADDFHF